MKNKWLLIMILIGMPAMSTFAQFRTLDYYVGNGLQNSPLLRNYYYQQASNLVDSEIIRANYKPQFAGASNGSYSPIIKGIGYDQAITNGGGLSALVGVNKQFASGKNLATQFETLQLANLGLQNASKITEQDLKRAITSQYITTYGDMLQLDFAKEINELLRKEEVILKKLTERNVYRQTDYLTFLVTYQQQQLSTKQQEIQFKNDLGTLNYLAGIFDTTTVRLQEPSINFMELPEPRASVFFTQYAIDSLKLVNSRALINLSYRPKVGVFADAGFNSTFAYSPYKNFGTSFGVNLTVPIYDGRKRKLQYRKLTISSQAIASNRTFFTSQYYQQIAQLTQQFKGTEELIGAINDQIKYSEALIQVNARLLETGDAKIADLVIAFNNYLTARNLLNQNKISRLQIISQINYWNR